VKAIVPLNPGLGTPATETGDPAHHLAIPIHDTRGEPGQVVLAPSLFEHCFELGGCRFWPVGVEQPSTEEWPSESASAQYYAPGGFSSSNPAIHVCEPSLS
jgi:hypothetical protein